MWCKLRGFKEKEASVAQSNRRSVAALPHRRRAALNSPVQLLFNLKFPARVCLPWAARRPLFEPAAGAGRRRTRCGWRGGARWAGRGGVAAEEPAGEKRQAGVGRRRSFEPSSWQPMWGMNFGNQAMHFFSRPPFYYIPLDGEHFRQVGGLLVLADDAIVTTNSQSDFTGNFAERQFAPSSGVGRGAARWPRCILQPQPPFD